MRSDGLRMVPDVGRRFLGIHRQLEAEPLCATPFKKTREIRVRRNGACVIPIFPDRNQLPRIPTALLKCHCSLALSKWGISFSNASPSASRRRASCCALIHIYRERIVLRSIQTFCFVLFAAGVRSLRLSRTLFTK